MGSPCDTEFATLVDCSGNCRSYRPADGICDSDTGGDFGNFDCDALQFDAGDCLSDCTGMETDVPCNDGDFLTSGDVCQNDGSCAGVSATAPTPAPPSMGPASEPWDPGMGDCYDAVGNMIPCEPTDPGMGDCNPDTAVCVESDLALMQGADFASLTPGCQCCFMSPRDDPSVDPFALCLGPLGPQVDFCASPGNATSNPDANTYECRHVCENWDASQDELEAAGCFNDQHEDQICVVDRVYAPGEMQPWGDTCCSWCEDWNADGNPDYEGCCEGMRADGEMGCEDSRCEWMCNGANCFDHGEDQATCEDNGGTWAVDTSCADQIAMQGMIQMQFEQEGMGADVAANLWLGQNGDVCCTGYEPAGPGSCDFDIDSYVSVSIACVAL